MQSDNAYILALAANALAAYDPKDDSTLEVLHRLDKMKKDKPDWRLLYMRGVSLELSRGRIVALLGANGAGKTTTLKAVSNLLEAERGAVTKGSILFQGMRVDRLSPSELVRLPV